MHAITGTLKDYDWGPVDGLEPWAGVTGAPQAELWFGAHPSGPSRLRDGGGRTLLDEVGVDEVPLLVKLLSAGSPLSIQVHPDAQLSATGRFTDRVEKNEMIVALEPFSAHAGWREADVAADILGAAGVPAEIVADVRAGRRERSTMSSRITHRIPDAWSRCSSSTPCWHPVMRSICPRGSSTPMSADSVSR